MAKIKVKQTKSIIGKTQKQVKTVQALGLKKIGQVVEHEDNAMIRGMINKVSHIVEVID